VLDLKINRRSQGKPEKDWIEINYLWSSNNNSLNKGNNHKLDNRLLLKVNNLKHR